MEIDIEQIIEDYNTAQPNQFKVLFEQRTFNINGMWYTKMFLRDALRKILIVEVYLDPEREVTILKTKERFIHHLILSGIGYLTQMPKSLPDKSNP